MKLSDDTIKNLVNYMNLKYLDSDRVSTKDTNKIVGEYEDEKVNNVKSYFYVEDDERIYRYTMKESDFESK